jgi:spermidine synthase
VSFYENGLLTFTYPDLLAAEETVHLALLQHQNPQAILLIGGGVGGRLNEILKTSSVQQVDYVELDPRLIELSRQFLPPKETEVLNDSRVNIYNQDGRFFVKNTKNSYDVVIIDLPDPHNTMVNRFYSLEFFTEVKRVLKPDGIISFTVTSSENVIGSMLEQFLQCLYNTLNAAYPHVIVLPGNQAHF